MSSITRLYWLRAIHDVKLLVISMSILLFGFSWLFIYLTSTFDLRMFDALSQFVPNWVKSLSGVEMSYYTTPIGQLSLLFSHPVMAFTMIAWALARGSDAVSGELDRGSMELLLAQPIKRTTVLAIHCSITALGSLILVLATAGGVMCGLMTTEFSAQPPPTFWELLPGLFQMFLLLICLTGLVTLASSFDRYRSRTVGIMAAVIFLQYILKSVAMLMKKEYAELAELVESFTIYGVYEPQVFIVKFADRQAEFFQYNLILATLGLLAFAGSLLVFSRRDLPAPL